MLHYLHLLLFLLLLLLPLQPLPLLLLLLLLQNPQVLHKTRVPLPHVRKKVLYGLNVCLLLALTLLLVLFLHFPAHPATVGITSVPLLNPDEGLIGCEVLPFFVELQYSVLRCGGIAKALVLLQILLQVFPRVVGLGFLGLYLFKNVSVDCIEAAF